MKTFSLQILQVESLSHNEMASVCGGTGEYPPLRKPNHPPLPKPDPNPSYKGPGKGPTYPSFSSKKPDGWSSSVVVTQPKNGSPSVGLNVTLTEGRNSFSVQGTVSSGGGWSVRGVWYMDLEGIDEVNTLDCEESLCY